MQQLLMLLPNETEINTKSDQNGYAHIKGRTEVRTRVTGIKIQCDNHYTIQHCSMSIFHGYNRFEIGMSVQLAIHDLYAGAS